MESSLILRAREFARSAHAGALRGNRVSPYIVHPARVAHLVELAGGSEEAIAAAWLHDVSEDCGVSIPELESLFGPVVARIVSEVSWPVRRPERMSHAAKVMYLRAHYPAMSPEARLVKISDNVANLEEFFGSPPRWNAERRESYLVYLSASRAALSGVCAELEERFDRCMELNGGVPSAPPSEMAF